MQELILTNVVGSAKTATQLSKEMLGPLLKFPFPIGHFVPSNWQPPTGYTLEKLIVNEVPIERLLPEGGGNGKVILYFHGGGYVAPLLNNSRIEAIHLSQLAHGCEVINVDYRVAPTFTYPAALEDCVTAYEAVLDLGYKGEDILFYGDSAGGGLVLAVTLYLKDHNMPLPKGCIALSPWTEVDANADSHFINQEKDLLLGKEGCSLAIEARVPSYRGNTDFKTPYLSPLYGDYTNFPTTLIQVGTYEVLYDDSRRVYEKAIAAGCDMRLSAYYGMFHCFQSAVRDIPESQMAWKEIIALIHEIFNLIP